MSTIRAEGLDDVVRALTNESVLAKARGAVAVGRTAKYVQETAKTLAPVGPGDPVHLADTIETDISGTRAVIGPTARWGKFVEEGTYKDAPQPYMAPALDAHEDDLGRELLDIVGNL